MNIEPAVSLDGKRRLAEYQSNRGRGREVERTTYALPIRQVAVMKDLVEQGEG